MNGDIEGIDAIILQIPSSIIGARFHLFHSEIG